METSQLIPLITAIVPSIIIGAVAYFFFKQYTETEAGKSRYRLHQENQKIALPLRLQAYERLTLFTERMAIGALVTRVKAHSGDINAYANVLTASIDQEFEHNLAQQIYVSPGCWNVIRTAKNTTISIIRKTAQSENVSTSDELRETLLRDLLENTSPSDTALSYIKNEIGEIMNI